ncbi:hypothetical protein D3C86_2080450 [compost metagenome]
MNVGVPPATLVMIVVPGAVENVGGSLTTMVSTGLICAMEPAIVPVVGSKYNPQGSPPSRML